MNPNLNGKHVYISVEFHNIGLNKRFVERMKKIQ